MYNVHICYIYICRTTKRFSLKNNISYNIGIILIYILNKTVLPIEMMQGFNFVTSTIQCRKQKMAMSR